MGLRSWWPVSELELCFGCVGLHKTYRKTVGARSTTTGKKGLRTLRTSRLCRCGSFVSFRSSEHRGEPLPRPKRAGPLSFALGWLWRHRGLRPAPRSRCICFWHRPAGSFVCRLRRDLWTGGDRVSLDRPWPSGRGPWRYVVRDGRRATRTRCTSSRSRPYRASRTYRNRPCPRRSAVDESRLAVQAGHLGSPQRPRYLGVKF